MEHTSSECVDNCLTKIFVIVSLVPLFFLSKFFKVILPIHHCCLYLIDMVSCRQKNIHYFNFFVVNYDITLNYNIIMIKATRQTKLI